MPVGDPPLRLRDLARIPVARLRGVGEKKGAALASAEITTVLDLLTHYPRRHLDRTHQAAIGDLAEGEEATVLGEVRSASTRQLRGRRSLTTVVIGDGGHRLSLAFFNQRWRERQLRPGMTVLVHGRCESFRGQRQMTGPVVDLVGDQTGRIVPVYPQSEKSGLLTRDIATFVEEALARCRPRGFADPVPGIVLDRLRLVDRGAAFEAIHQPETMAGKEEARRRLVFDELLRVQLELVRRKRRIERETAGIAHTIDGALTSRFLERLPFPLTGAQARAIAEIDADLPGDQFGQHLAPFGGPDPIGQQLDLERPVAHQGRGVGHAEITQHRSHAGVVLFGQHLGGCHQCRLVASLDRHEKGMNGDEGLSRADIALCLLYTSPSPRDLPTSRMPSSA